jgi:hypothetical protein
LFHFFTASTGIDFSQFIHPADQENCEMLVSPDSDTPHPSLVLKQMATVLVGKESEVLQQSVAYLMLVGVLARSSGHKNAQLHPKVKAFGNMSYM